MSSKGNPYDNAMAENFFSIRKTECIYRHKPKTFKEAKDGVAESTVLDPYTVYEVGGKKIAVVGITTPETISSTTPAYFQDENGNYIYGIAGGEDGAALYAAVQSAIDDASKEADIVIALGHLGDDATSAPWRSEDVIANTTGLDAFIDGHSHSTVPVKAVTDKGGNTVILTQTGEYFGAVGKMTISDNGITTELLTAEDLATITPDAEVKAIEDAWIAELEAQLGQVIGSTDVTFDNYDASGNRLVRRQETNSGDFAADALYYLFDDMGMAVPVPAGQSLNEFYCPAFEVEDFSQVVNVNKEGMIFEGWYTDEQLTQAFDYDTPVTQDITLYGKWTPITYTVTYVADGKIVGTVTVNHGEDAIAPALPEKEGYTAAWDLDGKNITADTTITAVYTEKSPQTGDSDMTVLLVALMLCAGCLATLMLTRKKRIS